MKVLLLTRFLDLSRKEGVGISRVGIELVKELKIRNIEIYKKTCQEDGLVPYFWYSAFDLKFLNYKDFTVIHALSPIENIWTPREKTVITYYDLFQYTNPDKIGGGMGYSSIKKFIGSNYFKIACNIGKKAKVITCISEKTKNELIEYLKVPEEKIRLIKLGIPSELDIITPKLPKPFLTIGYLGMLDKRKRVNLLIEDFKKSKLDATLLIAGNGLDMDILKEQAQNDIRIRFMGAIPEKHLSTFYNSLDYFIFPSAIEGYGLPMIEAMACKVPVVTLKDSNIPEEVRSRTTSVKSIKGFLSILERGKVSETDKVEEAYSWAHTHSWKTFTSEYIKIYKEIANA